MVDFIMILVADDTITDDSGYKPQDSKNTL